MSLATSAPLSPEAYAFIADLVYAHSRIRLGSDKQALVTGRLGKRLRQLGLASFEDYCALLNSGEGEEELGPLVDLISTNHTHFFRERQHLDHLRDHLLPEWTAQRGRSDEIFRFWSAACSSGEEPYTVSIVLAEFAREHGPLRWHLEASDISSRVLARAREGIYPAERVVLPDPAMLPRYFQKGTGTHTGYLRVKESLRSAITFHRMNLLQETYPVHAPQHAIFCRNVMIYFDAATQQELVGKLVDHLAPGGYLVVGHSESLLGVKHGLKTVKGGIYRKP